MRRQLDGKWQVDPLHTQTGSWSWMIWKLLQTTRLDWNSRRTELKSGTLRICCELTHSATLELTTDRTTSHQHDSTRLLIRAALTTMMCTTTQSIVVDQVYVHNRQHVVVDQACCRSGFAVGMTTCCAAAGSPSVPARPSTPSRARARPRMLDRRCPRVVRRSSSIELPYHR